MPKVGTVDRALYIGGSRFEFLICGKSGESKLVANPGYKSRISEIRIRFADNTLVKSHIHPQWAIKDIFNCERLPIIWGGGGDIL